MQIALLLYENMTALDAVSPYEVLAQLPEAQLRFVAATPGPKRTDSGLVLVATEALAEVPAPDIVLVPGSSDPSATMADAAVLAWLRAVNEHTTWTTSVCTGSLILGAAGLLEGKRATSNWLLLDALPRFGADPVGGRWVEDGKVLTAAGVTAGIDMALHLVATEVGPEVAQAVQLGIEYDPDPPFDSGSPQKAAPEIVELVTAVAEQSGSLSLDPA